MAVTKVGHEWFSDLTGHRYQGEVEALHFDQREQMKRSTPAELALDQVPLDELRTHISGRLAHEAVKEALTKSAIPIALITRGIPWYIDSQSNADCLMEELRYRLHERTLTPPISIDQWLGLVLEMRDAGRLEINEAAVQAEETARVEKEIASRKVYTEAELDKMPTHQLERLARGLPIDS